MIVEVALRILTDDGIPLITAVRTDQTLTEENNFDANMARSGSRLADLRDDAEKSIHRQLGDFRDWADRELGGEPPQPPGGGRRGHGPGRRPR